MGRLTNNIDYCDTNCDFVKRGECFFKDKSKCYEKSMHNKLKAFEDIIDEPEKLLIVDKFLLEKCEEINKLTAELAEYKKLEEEGLLLRLPFDIGIKVYVLTKTLDIMQNKIFYKINAFKVKEYKYNFLKNFVIICQEEITGFEKHFFKGEVGKILFLTKEEAEQALERMKEVL